MNDAFELRFGKTELAEELERESERLNDHVDGSALSSRASVLSLVAGMLQPDDDVMDRAVLSGAYVACFCEEGDLLSQWRGYAGADGYALGFRATHLVEREYDVLGPVQYGAPAVSALVDEIVPGTAQFPVNHPYPSAVAVIENTVLPRLAGIKHESFAEEREWRLIALRDPTDDELLFRAGAFGVVPYFSLRSPQRHWPAWLWVPAIMRSYGRVVFNARLNMFSETTKTDSRWKCVPRRSHFAPNAPDPQPRMLDAARAHSQSLGR